MNLQYHESNLIRICCLENTGDAMLFCCFSSNLLSLVRSPCHHVLNLEWISTHIASFGGDNNGGNDEYTFLLL